MSSAMNKLDKIIEFIENIDYIIIEDVIRYNLPIFKETIEKIKKEL